MTLEQIRTDKPGITWISSVAHSCYPFLRLSFNLFPQFSPYFNGGPVSAGDDCLIDRFWLLEWWDVEAKMDTKDGVRALLSAGKRHRGCWER